MKENKFINPKPLKDKVAIVTGAGSGIGKAITEAFLEAGAIVVAADLNLESVQTLATEFHTKNVKPLKVDVSSKEEVEGMIDYAITKLGKLDILVNNAGIVDKMLPIAELDDEMWERIWRVNTNSVMYSTRKSVQYFLKNGGGKIINIASVGGLYGRCGGAAYTASKFAVVGLTKNTAFMYGNKGVRCNVICPGAIRTNIASGLVGGSEYGFERTNPSNKLIARLGNPEEIAAVALFLAGDGASYMNGSTIIADDAWLV